MDTLNTLTMCDNTSCRLCEVPAVKQLVSQCVNCKKEPSGWQYAAINSYELSIGLPVVSPYLEFQSCRKPEVSCTQHSPMSTLLSVLYSVDNMCDVVHFGKPPGYTYSDIIHATNAMRQTPSGCTVAVEFTDNSPTVLHVGNDDITIPIDAAAIALVSSLLREPATISWQWTSASPWVSNVFHPNNRSMWLCYNACTITRRFRMSGGKHCVTAIPLHSSSASYDTVTVNVGVPTLDTMDNTRGLRSTILKSVASEFNDCVMKDSKCFSCSRVMLLHDAMCGKSGRQQAPQQRVIIFDRFSQCLTLTP